MPGGGGAVDPAVLVVCRKLGIADVFRVNGPAGVAALGFGTESIPKVRKIVGPGSPAGDVRPGRDAAPRGGDDDGARADREPGDRRRLSADPVRLAADLLIEAEHGTDSSVVLVTTSADARRRRPTPSWPASSPTCPAVRADAARASLGVNGGCVLVDELAEAVAVANRYAPEHLQVAVADDAVDARRRRPGQRRRDPRRPAHPVQRGQLRDRLPGVAADVGLRRGLVGHHRRGVPQAHRRSPGPTPRARPGWRRRSSPSPTTRASPPTPPRSAAAPAERTTRARRRARRGAARLPASGRRGPGSRCIAAWVAGIGQRAGEGVGLGEQLLDDAGLGPHDAGLGRRDGVRRERRDPGRRGGRRTSPARRSAAPGSPSPTARPSSASMSSHPRIDLERPAAPDQPGQAHRARAAGDDAERDLGLVEHRRRRRRSACRS